MELRMKTTTELKELIDFLRAEGVLSYENDGVRLTLLPERPDSTPVTPSKQDQRRDKRYHKTEAEQIELFGVIVSPVEQP